MRCCTVSRRLTIAIVLGTCFLSLAEAQSNSERARIALYEPVGQKEDTTLASVLSTLTDSVELSLVVLQRYDVRRLGSADPAQGLSEVRAYCEANRIDQAILGSGRAHPGGGYDFRLVVYDRQKEAVTFDKSGTASGALDIFDTTDALVASLLDALSGTHLLYGSLSVGSDPGGARVAVNGKEVGTAPLTLRGLPVGTVEVSARAEGHEDASARVKISDGETSDTTLKLARSVGTLRVTVPADAVVKVSSAEVGEKEITGSGEMQLPTGDYDVAASSAGLQGVSQRATVQRNGSTEFLPWPKGYLVVDSTVAGAHVFVDGVDKGEAPRLVEVEPEGLHAVELRKEHYAAYWASLSASAGSKTRFAADPVALPGSIRVETSIAGASGYLDDQQEGVSPIRFENVPAGEHVVKIDDVKVGDRWYTVGGPTKVEVGAGEDVVLSKTFVVGMAHLVIKDAPSGSVLSIDGEEMDPAAFTTGIEIQAETTPFL